MVRLEIYRPFIVSLIKLSKVGKPVDYLSSRSEPNTKVLGVLAFRLFKAMILSNKHSKYFE